MRFYFNTTILNIKSYKLKKNNITLTWNGTGAMVCGDNGAGTEGDNLGDPNVVLNK